MLCYLAERPGALVHKEELFSQLWPGTAVTDDSLTKSIREIRDALGDNAKAPRFVATVHRRGFRFIAETSPGHAPSPLDGSAAEGWAAASGGRDTAHSQPATNFVGRAHELQQLSATFRHACNEHRQIVFITGEPGIGKTALVEAFLRGLEVPQSAILLGRGSCVEQRGEREAYLPVLAALEEIGRDPHAKDILPLLRRFAPTWLAQVPWLAEADHTETLAPSLADTKPPRMQREFCAFVEALTEQRPLILLLEDLHWSDPATIELLAMLAERRTRARLLVIGTYRPADAHEMTDLLLQAKQTLQMRRQCSEIALNYLTNRDLKTYVEKRLPGYDRPQRLAQLIYEHTEGSPLFMSAVLEDLIARGWLVKTAPGWALTVPLAKADLGIPDDLRQMITLQLQAMKPGDQALLEAASVAGFEFAAEAVAGGAGISVDEAITACEQLSRLHRFVRAMGALRWPDGVTRRYGFIHAIYQHVIYEAIPEKRRQHLHRRIGETLETAYGIEASEIAAELAVHFENAGDWPRTIKYLKAVAGRARRRFDNAGAIAALEKALGLMRLLPSGEAHQRQELELRILLGPAQGARHGFASEEAAQNYARARVLNDAVGSPADTYGVLYSLWHSQAFRAEPAAEASAQQLAQLPSTIGDRQLRLQADALVGRTALCRGRFVESRDRLGQVLEAWRDSRDGLDGSLFGIEPLVAANSHYALALGFLGYPDSATEEIRRSLALAEETARPLTRAGTLFLAAYFHHLLRNVQGAWDLAQQSLALSIEHGLPFTKAQSTALSGWVLAQRGEHKRAISMIQQGIAEHLATGARLLSSHFFAFLADAYRRLGDTKAGLAAVEEGIAIADTTLDSAYLAELWRIKGALLLEPTDGRGRSGSSNGKRTSTPKRSAQEDQAEDCLQRALEIARRDSAKWFELRAAIDLARLRDQQGKPAAGLTLLANVYSSFTGGFDTADLREAKVMISRATSGQEIRIK